MAKAYSLDLRQRVFNLLAQGESKLFIEETLDCYAPQKSR